MGLYGVATGESPGFAEAFIEDTGLLEPVLLDDSKRASSGCFSVPDGAETLFEHLDTRVGAPGEGPFPLQIVVDGAGRIAYASRDHDPVAVLAALQAASLP